MRGTTGRKPCQSLLSNRNQRYYYHNKFLKPGALARLRDFKLSSRSRIFDSHTKIPLSDLLTSHSSSTSTSSSSDQTDPAPDQINFGVPCFALRTNRPRCLLRKKLFAVAPVFSESTQCLSVISWARAPYCVIFYSVVFNEPAVQCSLLLQNHFEQNFEWSNLNRRFAYYASMKKIESRNSLGQEEESSCNGVNRQRSFPVLNWAAGPFLFSLIIRLRSFSVRSPAMRH